MSKEEILEKCMAESPMETASETVCLEAMDLHAEKVAVAWDIFKVKGGWSIAGYNESEKDDPIYIHITGGKKKYSDLYQYFIENVYNQ